jgi:hypothetical protein
MFVANFETGFFQQFFFLTCQRDLASLSFVEKHKKLFFFCKLHSSLRTKNAKELYENGRKGLILKTKTDVQK